MKRKINQEYTGTEPQSKVTKNNQEDIQLDREELPKLEFDYQDSQSDDQSDGQVECSDDDQLETVDEQDAYFDSITQDTDPSVLCFCYSRVASEILCTKNINTMKRPGEDCPITGWFEVGSDSGSVAFHNEQEVTSDDNSVQTSPVPFGSVVCLSVMSENTRLTRLYPILMFRNLRELDLFNCRVLEFPITDMIKKVNFSCCKMSDELVEELILCPSLERLTISESDFTDHRAEIVSRNGNITRLDITGFLLTHDGIKHISKMSQLKSLSITDGEIESRSIKSLTKLNRLDHLSLVNCNLGSSGFRRMKRFTRLSSLSISFSKIDQDSIEHISSISALSHLKLDHAHLTDECCKAISGMKNLLTLSLSNNAITHIGTNYLFDIPLLTSLNLKSNHVGNEGLNLLSKKCNSNITRLNLSNNGLDNGAARSLFSIKKLEDVSLEGNNISDTGALLLSRMTNIYNLNVRNNSMSHSSKQLLLDSIPSVSV